MPQRGPLASPNRGMSMTDTLAIDPGARLKELGLVLPKPWGSVPGRAQPRDASENGAPAPLVLGPGVKVHAEFVRVVGRRVIISGHLPIDAEGRVSGPFGRVGAERNGKFSKNSSEFPYRDSHLRITTSID